MCAWDKTQPLGSDLANTIDNEMREMKTDIEAALQGQATEGDEAIFPGSDSANPAFRYRGLKGGTGSRPASGQYGLYFDTTRNAMQRDNGSSWDDVGTMIPSGTIMLFRGGSVPTGWTIDTNFADRMLRIVTSAGTGSGGTSDVSSGLSHTHTISHSHSIPTTAIEHNHHSGLIIKSDGSGLWGVAQVNSHEGDASSETPIGTFNTNIGAQSGATYALTSAVKNHSAGTSGTDGTASSDPTPTFKYVDTFLASKD